MDNPGDRDLGTATLSAINAATSATVITSLPDRNGQTVAYLDRLEGMKELTVSAYFTYGSGGTSLKVDVETTFNQGLSWVPIHRFAFAQASAEKVINLIAGAQVTSYEPVALGDDLSKNGLLGTRVRVRITTVGTYAGATSLAVRANVK